MVRKKRKGIINDTKYAVRNSKNGAPTMPIPLSSIFSSHDIPDHLEMQTLFTNATTLREWYIQLSTADSLSIQISMLQQLLKACKVVFNQYDENVDIHASYHCVVGELWKVLFQLYISNHIGDLHKYIQLLLKLLAATKAFQDVTSRPFIIARNELVTIMNNIFTLHTVLDSKNNNGSQVNETRIEEKMVSNMESLLLILEIPFLTQLIINNLGAENFYDENQSYILQLISCILHYLERLSSTIINFDQSSTSVASEQTDISINMNNMELSTSVSTNEILIASDRCSHVFRVLMKLFSKIDGNLKLELKRILLKYLTTVISMLSSIMLLCCQILHAQIVQKDLLTQTGLSYCVVMRWIFTLSDNGEGKSIDDEISTMIDFILLITEKSLDHNCSRIQAMPEWLQVQIKQASSGSKPDDRSQLALYRGLLNCLSDEELSLQYSSSNTSSTSILEELLLRTFSFCKAETTAPMKLFSFQVLDAMFRRAVSATDVLCNTMTVENTTLSKLDHHLIKLVHISAVMNELYLNWDHPSKKVNQFMSPLFTQLVAYVHRSFLCIPNEMNDLTVWSFEALSLLLQFPATRRAKYSACLILLIAHDPEHRQIIVKRLLRSFPMLLIALLESVGNPEVSAAAANLYVQITEELLQLSKYLSTTTGEENTYSLAWIESIVELILGEDVVLRERIAMYILPRVISIDPMCVLPFLEKIREQLTSKSYNRSLWIIMETLKCIRKLNQSTFTDSTTSQEEFRNSLESGDPKLRHAAFDALCACRKTTEMPKDWELRLIISFLSVQGKEIPTPNRTTTLLGLKHICFRVKERLRIIQKSKIESHQEELLTANKFKGDLYKFIINSVHSGAIPQRIILGLESMLIVHEIFGYCQKEDFSQQDIGAGLPVISAHMVTSLLNLLINSWDIIRSLVCSVLEKMTSFEFLGLVNISISSELSLNKEANIQSHHKQKMQLASLIMWGIRLCGSPQQRESEAGAMLVRLLWKNAAKCISDYKLNFLESDETYVNKSLKFNVADPTTNNYLIPDIYFIQQLAIVIQTRLQHGNFVENVADVKRSVPMVHGLLLALRYIISEIAFSEINIDNLKLCNQWRNTLSQVIDSIYATMASSLAVVGEATSGCNIQVSANDVLTDVQKKLIFVRSDKLSGDIITEKKMVVGSWLAAKECGNVLDTLLKRITLPDNENQVVLLSRNAIEHSGEVLLLSLLDMKHKGAVSSVYVAFEGICRSLLTRTTAPHLTQLPMKWANQLLMRLEKAQQHFILRRSSGFAFAFVAILRAEPRNSAAIILPKVMAYLLELARWSKKQMHDKSRQKSRVHALNILKLIAQDAVLADDVSIYMSEMVSISLQGFQSNEEWAVRNSSMMLFAAAVQRVIGDKRIADGSISKFESRSKHTSKTDIGVKSKIYGADIFSRFPALQLILLNALKDSITIKHDASGIESSATFPILMLLSRLEPGVSAAVVSSDNDKSTKKQIDDSDDLSLLPFISVVMSCAHHRIMAIRNKAGTVLASITPCNMVIDILRNLCQILPKDAKIKCNTNTAKCSLTYNSVHGTLVQINSLVAKHASIRCKNDGAKSADVRNKILEIMLAEFIPSTLWLQDANMIQSGIIRTAYLQILSTFILCSDDLYSKYLSMGIEGSIYMKIKKKIHVRCEDILKVDLGRKEFMDVNSSETRLIICIFFALYNSDDSHELNTVTLALLKSPILEIRKKTSKHILHLMNGEHIMAKFDKTAMLICLMEYLPKYVLFEEHPKVKKRLIEVLLECEKQVKLYENEYVVIERVLCTFEYSLEAINCIIEESQDPHLLSTTLEYYARTMFRWGAIIYCSKYENTTYHVNLSKLRDVVTKYAEDTQPFVLRLAAARAISYSGILSITHSEEFLKKNCVELLLSWRSALVLVQDQDESIRTTCRKAIAQAFQSHPKFVSYAPSLSDASILPIAVEYEVTMFGCYPDCQGIISEHLFQLLDFKAVIEPYITQNVLSRKTALAHWTVLTSDIFDTENANDFIERNFLAQLYIYHMLVNPIINKNKDGSRQFHFNLIQGTKRRILENLLLMYKELRMLYEQKLDNQWLGGAIYYGKIYSELSSLLCAAAAVIFNSQFNVYNKQFNEPPADDVDLLQEVRAMSSAMNQLISVGHPTSITTALAFLQDYETLSYEKSLDMVLSLLYLTPYSFAY